MKWKKIRLSNVCDVRDGTHASPKYHSFGYPLVTSKNLKCGKLDISDVNLISEEDYNEINKRSKVDEGDILMPMIGTIGNPIIIDHEPKFAIKNVCLIKKSINASNRFIYYLFQSQIFEQNLLNQSRGGTQKFLSLSDIRNFEIPLPPLHIQQQIAATLDKANALRRKDQELLKKYDELTQAIFYEMFGDPRINLKKWQKTTLGQACLMIKDGPHISPKYVEFGVPFISVNNIINGDWNLTNVKYISEEDHAIFKKRCNPVYGDVLYTKGGTTGYAKFVDVEWRFTNWVHLAVLKFDHSLLDGRFLESMLNTNFCYQQSQLFTRGIANRDLVLGEMKKIEIILPPIREQKKYSDFITLLLSQREKVKISDKRSNLLFQSLLKESFS